MKTRTPEEAREIAARFVKLKEMERLKVGLPHLHGFPWYPWAKAFSESENKNNFLCAANQISKSSTQIRKNIDWATDTDKWARRWPGRRPRQFWYLYPTKDVVQIEFEKKWIPEFLPTGEYKDSEKYGWESEYKNKSPFGLHFKSGVSIYFKTYAQNVKDLQSGTVDMVSFDEELPEEFYEELNFRRSATDGYLNGVFTATLGQDFWRRVIEERGEFELLKDALKLQVSMFDCMKYDDGAPSLWTMEKIQRQINSCKSDAEVQRRVYGRFVLDSGLKYPSFSRKKNMKPAPGPVPKDWAIYVGVDLGQGKGGHPPAIVFIAMRPDYQFGRVFKGWRGDDDTYTSGDVLAKFIEMRGELKMTGQYYDWHGKDFFTIASRIGEAFSPAEKSHDIGEHMLNVLFKNDMLIIDEIPELEALAQELTTLKSETPKTKAKDDFIDGMRYGVTRIPWDFSAIPFDAALGSKNEKGEEIPKAEQARAKEQKDRRDMFFGEKKDRGIDDEFEEWNELYDV